MNRQEKIDAIYDKIADKTLSFGCKVLIKTYYGDEEDIVVEKVSGGIQCRCCGYVHENYILKIIGHPVMLGDVLDFIFENEMTKFENIGISEIKEKLIKLWILNLRNPIEDQSDEGVDFVYNLIKYIGIFMKIFYNIKKIIFNKFFMEKENFKLRYFGKEGYDNEINAKDLAGSILALSELLNSLNEEFGSKNKKIELKIKGWEKGSFITDLVIVGTSFSGPILSIFQSGLGVKELLELSGLTGGAGLLGFIDKLKGEKPLDVKIIGDNATVVTGSGNTININTNIYKAFQNNKNLENIKYLKEPLENENIDGLEVEYNGKKEILIDEKNKDFFDFAGIDENDIEIEETNILLKISSINFGVGKKWKFKAMGIEFWALIVDEKFNKELSQKNFSSGDELFVILETKKYGNKYSRKILEVIEHKKTPKQSELLQEQN